MTHRKSRVLSVGLIIAAALGLPAFVSTTSAIAVAPVRESNCVTSGRECSKDEILSLCVPIWFGGKPTDPTNPVDKFCRAKHPDELS